MTQDVPPSTMDETTKSSEHSPVVVDALKLAMRRARSDDAERSGARAELRASRLGRLELLQDALQPLLVQIPSDVDMFDIALVPSSDPRLFIDMIGFVEMGRDARSYLLQQDTRHGRIRVAESESIEAMVEAVTDYVARRLLERDKALASDARSRSTSKWIGGVTPTGGRTSEPVPTSAAVPVERAPDEAAPLSDRPKRSAPLRWAGIAFAFLIDLLGAIAFFMIIGGIGWYLWLRAHAPM